MATTDYAEAFCVNCGETVQVHADTRRCQRCGKGVGVQPLVPIKNGIGHLPPVSKVALESTAQSRRWMASSRGLIDGLEDEATALRSGIETSTKRLAELEVVLSALRGMLHQVQLEDAPEPKPVGRRPRPWAMTRDGATFAACSKCGLAARKHKSKGLCEGCYR